MKEYSTVHWARVRVTVYTYDSNYHTFSFKTLLYKQKCMMEPVNPLPHITLLLCNNTYGKVGLRLVLNDLVLIVAIVAI